MRLRRASCRIGLGAFLVAVGMVGTGALGAEGPSFAAAPGPHAHPVPDVAWALPFATLLGAIAVFPLGPGVVQHWWEKHHIKLMLGLALGAVVLVHYGTRGYGVHGAAPGAETVRAVLGHAILGDYVPFIVLLFSLYVIAGGLQLKGDLRAHPGVNTGLLGLGAVMASLVGTTGASMILIRPLLQTNRQRKHVAHTVIFFIFLVSNVGGCLTPLGDPPLFLGYLRGVPFLWTLSLVGPWFFCVAALMAIYYAWDVRAYRREAPEDVRRDEAESSRPRLRGQVNLVWLAGVVLAVALIVPGQPIPGTSLMAGPFHREAVMLACAGLSWRTTPRGLRREVEFDFGAIAEVACLFLGIFLTMQVPIEILGARGRSLGLTSPGHFFWWTGALSSVLDNAPTYLVFLQTAASLDVPPGVRAVDLLGGEQIRPDLLRAISLGAVFMGANTYIGNGPNFMVKAIAERAGVRMPGFFGYLLYSGAVLLPLFGLVALLFLGG